MYCEKIRGNFDQIIEKCEERGRFNYDYDLPYPGYYEIHHEIRMHLNVVCQDTNILKTSLF